MRNDSRSLIALGLAAVAGGALGYFLATEDGRKMRMQAAMKIGEFSESTKESIESGVNQISSKTQEVLANAKVKANEVASKTNTVMDNLKTKAEDLASNAKNLISNTSDEMEKDVDEAESKFKEGVNKAKRKVKATNNALQNGVA